MRFFDLLIMSINNLRRRKLRTGLTVLGVVIGTASIVVMVSLGIGLKENTVESYASFGSLTRIQISSGYGNQSEDDYLVDATVTKLAKIPHVKSVSPILETDVNLKQGVYQGYSNIVGFLFIYYYSIGNVSCLLITLTEVVIPIPIKTF